MTLRGSAGVTDSGMYSNEHDLSVHEEVCGDNFPALDFSSCTSAVRQRFPRLLKLVSGSVDTPPFRSSSAYVAFLCISTLKFCKLSL